MLSCEISCIHTHREGEGEKDLPASASAEVLVTYEQHRSSVYFDRDRIFFKSPQLKHKKSRNTRKKQIYYASQMR